MPKKPLTYKDSGVDIEAGDSLVEDIRKHNPRIGGFGGFMRLPKGMADPQLVLSTDGVGTKLLVAEALGRFDTIGIDLVAMCVNDIVTTGARPIAFLDYYATERLDRVRSRAIIEGIVAGCRQAGCELAGGETAELPGVYPKDGFDLAGFAVGVVDRKKAVNGKKVRADDVIIGMGSSGIHSNGYSLARRIASDKRKFRGEEQERALKLLLEPTLIYVKPVLKLLAKVKVKALAHITGGGLEGNLPRVFPPTLDARLDAARWQVPEVFPLLAGKGPVETEEMFRVFNMGIGMCAVVGAKEADAAVKLLRRSKVNAWAIGRMEKGSGQVVIENREAAFRQSSD